MNGHCRLQITTLKVYWKLILQISHISVVSNGCWATLVSWLYWLLMNFVVLELWSLWKSRMKICFLYWVMDSLQKAKTQPVEFLHYKVTWEDRRYWLTVACARWCCWGGKIPGGRWFWKQWASGKLPAGQAVGGANKMINTLDWMRLRGENNGVRCWYTAQRNEEHTPTAKAATNDYFCCRRIYGLFF